MNRKDEMKIEILSNIDERIIDKQSVKRYDYLSGKAAKRKKFITGLCSAACFILLFSVVFTVILPMLTEQPDDPTPPVVVTKQVPVYEGMTVTNELPAAATQETTAFGNIEIDYLSSVSGKIRKLGKGTDRKPIADISGILDVEGSGRTEYYASKWADIYITIHLNNPDQFEILSFTLNGVKYQSYMFENGSDSENLILKLNVGEAEGVVEYTIDAIKYVDGEEIKDVEMRGDKTVKVGVYPESQPTAQVQASGIDFHELSFDITVADPLSLISDSEGEICAYLIEGEETVNKAAVSVGDATLRFDKLKSGSTYRLVIIAYYDALDGERFAAHVLYDADVKTKALVSVTDVLVNGDTSVTFDLQTASGYDVTIEKTELVGFGDNVAQEGDGNTREFTDLYIGSYTIYVTYSYYLDGVKYTGVGISTDKISVDKLSSITKIVESGTMSKYYSDYPVWNPSTMDYRDHLGIDIASATSQEEVYAAASGTVTDVYFDHVYGYTVVVAMPDRNVYMIYQCLDGANTGIKVKEGDMIVGGQLIGYTFAEMQEVAEPDHVHFAIRENGAYIDPQKYVSYEITE